LSWLLAGRRPNSLAADRVSAILYRFISFLNGPSDSRRVRRSVHSCASR
jgi:hypothetical protein